MVIWSHKFGQRGRGRERAKLVMKLDTKNNIGGGEYVWR